MINELLEKYNNGNVALTQETVKEVIGSLSSLNGTLTAFSKFIATAYYYSEDNRKLIDSAAKKAGRHIEDFLQTCIALGRGDLYQGLIRKRGDYRFGIACKLPYTLQKTLSHEMVIFVTKDKNGFDEINLDFWKMTKPQIDQLIDYTECRLRSKKEQMQYINTHNIPQPVTVEWSYKMTNQTPLDGAIADLEEKLEELKARRRSKGRKAS